MTYMDMKVYLTPNQVKKLKNAINKKSSISFRINPKQKGNISLLLTQTQKSKFLKNIPFNLKLSISQVTALAKHGGFLITLPTLLAAATAIGSLAGGASAIAKTVNDKNATQKQLEETRRHNLQMEKKKTNGKGLFFKTSPSSTKNWRGSVFKTIQKMNIPMKALSQYDLMRYVNELKIPNFKGIYMRDALPKKSNKNKKECGILNLDSIKGSGTHWTCWFKKCNNLCYYFDSFGVVPPKEFENYVQCDIVYSTYQIQKFSDVICGHLCLTVLYALAVLNINFHSILFFLYNK